MKISPDTLAILKNFSTINSNLVVKEGNTIRTISPGKNILTEATVAETFDTPFGIWDLSQFLAAVSLFKDPDFDFQKDHVVIRSSGTKASVKYYYSSPELLVSADKKLNMPPTKVNFTLTVKDLNELMRASSVLGVPDLSLESANDRMVLRVWNRKDPTSHDFSIDVGENISGAEFQFLFKVENLRLLPAEYSVSVSDKKVAQFESQSNDVTYWISLETDSTYTAGNKSHAATR
jgi:hypothetical protein